LESDKEPEGVTMLERDMEDLIARHPDDFFPGRGFELKGRQKSFAGVGRFDLLFEDRFKTNILIELKAVPAKYEDATQLAKYKDELQNRGEKHILMWLVAPQLSNSVREFLDRIGIEYTEIHEAEYRRVAETRGLSIRSEAPTAIQPTVSLRSSPREKTPKSGRRTVLPLEKTFPVIKSSIYEVYGRQQTLVTRDQLAKKLGEQTWVREALSAAGITDSIQQDKRIGNQIDFFSAHYKLKTYGLEDEFDRDEIDGKWAYRPKLPSPIATFLKYEGEK
jgi:hypothetical protein